jgi:magnesium transporter
MTEPTDGAEPGSPQDKAAEAEGLYGLAPQLVDNIREGLREGQTEAIARIMEPLHPADTADLIETLSGEDRRRIVDLLRRDLDGEVLTYLDERVRDEVVEQLDAAEVAGAIGELDIDDQVEVLEDLDEADQREILEAVPEPERTVLEEALAYPEDSAGRLMQREFVSVPSHWTVGDAIDFARAAVDLPDDFYDLFVVDAERRPIGTIPLSRVLRTRRQASLAGLMDTDVRTIPVTEDQEEVALMFRQYGLVSAPVVDEAGRIIGVITVDDVVEVLDEEHEVDLMHLGGLSEDDLYSSLVDTARARFPWLMVNLLTALVASVVIAVFEDTIERLVALAVLMPIVASMGGNAGTQTLTVAVRALAVKDLTAANARRVIGKELIVGVVNGLLFAALAGAVSWFWFGNPGIGVVMGVAMIITLVAAALAGMGIPLSLERLRVDPAVASGVLLTTITDVVGFFAFLGLAAFFLL